MLASSSGLGYNIFSETEKENDMSDVRIMLLAGEEDPIFMTKEEFEKEINDNWIVSDCYFYEDFNDAYSRYYYMKGNECTRITSAHIKGGRAYLDMS